MLKKNRIIIIPLRCISLIDGPHTPAGQLRLAVQYISRSEEVSVFCDVFVFLWLHGAHNIGGPLFIIILLLALSRAFQEPVGPSVAHSLPGGALYVFLFEAKEFCSVDGAAKQIMRSTVGYNPCVLSSKSNIVLLLLICGSI